LRENDFHKEDFSANLSDWLKDVEDTITLTTADKVKINTAGASAYALVLEKNTRNEHYDMEHHKKGEPHLADTVGIQPSKDVVGAVDAGFADKRAYIARFLNDGTKKMHGDHFVDKSRAESIPLVIKAQEEAYKNIIGSK
jgi:hypothetical protein